jgi:hypothetical protein
VSEIDDNPYRAPDSDIDSSGRPFDVDESSLMRVDGKFLVVRSGVVLPSFCVKTNAPIPQTNLRKKTLTWCPPYVFAFIVFGGLLLIIVYFIVRKRCELTYVLSAAVRQQYLNWLIVKSLIAVAMLFVLPLAVEFSDTVSVVVVVLFLLSVIALFLGNSPLAITKHQKGEFWVSGCSTKFLSRIPEGIETSR